MTEMRVLRPLVWYGLLDQKPQREKTARAPFLVRHVYRKAPLFDRFLVFDVRTKQAETVPQ